jgi:hypothetical protein
MATHDLDLDPARIHIAQLMAEAESERLARQPRPDRQRLTIAGRPVARLAVMVGLTVVVALRALPGTL